MPLMIPADTMVSISQFGRGTASSEFAKVQDGTPVTVMKNNRPTYFIINEHDYRRFQEHENELLELRNKEARRQALEHEYTHSSDTVEDMMDYLNEL